MSEPQLLSIEKTCDYCGAKLEISSVAAHSEPHPYHYECPQCGRSHEIVSFAPPHVRVVAPRTDGKNDSYQQTMF